MSTEQTAQQTTKPVTAAKPDRQRSGSPRGTRHDKRWTEVSELVVSGATVSATVIDIATNKEGQRRGLSVKLHGLRGFLPGSEVPRGTNVDELKGKTVQVKVLESDPTARGGRLIVSMKAIVDGERKQFIEGLQVGSEVIGKVVAVLPYGYFVNIGPLDALLPIKQTSLEGGQPKVLTEGETVTARVKEINLDGGKVALTMRQSRTGESDARRHTSGAQHASRNTARFDRKPSVSSPLVSSTATASKKVVTSGKPRKTAATKKSPYTHSFSSFEDLGKWFKETTREGDTTSSDSPVSAAEQA